MWRGDGAGAHVSEGVSGHLKLAGCLVQPGCCHQLRLKYWPSSTHYDVRLRLTAHTPNRQQVYLVGSDSRRTEIIQLQDILINFLFLYPAFLLLYPWN